ncbi:MAG: alpha/beta fold hydrolase [Lysobacteraceae bacterium]
MRIVLRFVKYTSIGLAVLLLGLAVAPWLVPMPERSPTPDQSPYPDGRMVEACGTRWHVRSWPATGEAHGHVVLVHGFAGSTFSWRHTAPALAAAGYRVDAIDLPPYGFGARRAPDRAPSTCAIEVLELAHGGGPLALVGHSMGASVVARMAQQLPHREPDLVLVGGGLGGMRRDTGVASTLLRFPPLGRWAEVVAHRRLLQPGRFADTLASAYGRRPTPEEVEGYRQPLLLAGTAPAVLTARAADLPLDVDALPAGALLLWGERDAWVPVAVGERTRERLRDPHWVVIPEAGHNPMETHPEPFNQHLLLHLERRSDPVTPGPP